MKKRNIRFSLIFLGLSFITSIHALELLHKLEWHVILQKKDERPLEEGFCLGTLIKTLDGYKPIENCVVGDMIVDSDGQITSIIAITKKCVDRYIEFLLDDDILCIGFDQLLYSNGNGAWLKASHLVSGVVHNKKIILYALTTQSHTLCVTKCDICAHNTAALFSQMTSASLGHIVIINPIAALLGGISISLAVIAYKAYEQYLKQTSEENYFGTNIPDTVVLAERFYYEQRKTELEKLRQELLSIKTDLTEVNSLSSMHLCGKILQKHVYNHSDNFQLLSIEQEKYFSDEQRHALRVSREKELEFLEKQIQDLQFLLALHTNQLINNISYLEKTCVQWEPKINAAIDCWNNHSYAITDVIAIQMYENIVVQDYLLNELCDAYNALIAIANYYQGVTSECIYHTTTIKQSLQEILPVILAKKKVIREAKCYHHNDFDIIEKYCVSRNIPIIFLRQQVKKKLEQQQTNYEAECLENAEKIISSGGSPGDPKKDDEEDKEEIDTTIKISEDDAPHMFQDRDGHIFDTPANRKLLIDLVSNKKNFLGFDSFGNQWFAKIVEEGRQYWAIIRGGLIRNGGINNVIRIFHPQTGLCKPPRL